MKTLELSKLRLVVFTLLLAIVSSACVYMNHKCETECVEVADVQVEDKEIQQVVDEIPVVEQIEIVEIEDEAVPTGQFYEVSDDEAYLLAKIVMAEAEGECLRGKALVAQVILNRVDDPTFPSTVEDVIFQETFGVFQFSPIGNGRFDRVEPSDECWKAVDLVLDGRYDKYDALYFTSSKEESTWHSRNLEFVMELGGHKFYK